MRAAEHLAVVAVAVAAVCSVPTPGQCLLLYRHLGVVLPEVLQSPRRLSGFPPRRCTTCPIPGPRSLPVPVDV